MGRLGNSKAVQPDLSTAELPKLGDFSYQELFLELTTDAILGLLKIGLHVRHSNHQEGDDEDLDDFLEYRQKPSGSESKRKQSPDVTDFLRSLGGNYGSLSSTAELTEDEVRAVTAHLTKLDSILKTNIPDKTENSIVKFYETVQKALRRNNVAQRNGRLNALLHPQIPIFSGQWACVVLSALSFDNVFLKSAIINEVFGTADQLNSCQEVNQKVAEILNPVIPIINPIYLKEVRLRCANVIIRRDIFNGASCAFEALISSYGRSQKDADRIQLLNRMRETLDGQYGYEAPICHVGNGNEVPLNKILIKCSSDELPPPQTLEIFAEALGDVPQQLKGLETSPYDFQTKTYLEQIKSVLGISAR